MAGMEQYLKWNKDIYAKDTLIRPYLVPLEVELDPGTTTTGSDQFNNPDRYVYFIKAISGYVLKGANEDALYVTVNLKVTHSDLNLMPTDRRFRLAWFMVDYEGSGNKKGLELNVPFVVRPGASIIANFSLLSGISAGTKIMGILLQGVLVDKNLFASLR